MYISKEIAQDLEILHDLAKQFKSVYGENEIILPEKIIVSEDIGYSGCSGSKGFLTALRVKNNKIEYYLDDWGGGWKKEQESDYWEYLERTKLIIKAVKRVLRVEKFKSDKNYTVSKTLQDFEIGYADSQDLYELLQMIDFQCNLE